jgi:hypothetical protein
MGDGSKRVAHKETEMKTYEVRIREESGEITSTFYCAEDAEHLFDMLSVASDNLEIVGYNVVGG